MLSIIRPGQPPLILDESEYGTLDPGALYSITSTFHIQGVLASEHNRIFDKAWKNRCRFRLADWFEEQGIYVVEMERVLYEPGNGGSPAAEWEGVWRRVDDSVYLLECKYYNITLVYSALVMSSLMGGNHHKANQQNR
jgi:hypothetical protein